MRDVAELVAVSVISIACVIAIGAILRGLFELARLGWFFFG
ncbi:MAG: hypothetical protein ACK5VI_10190 [Opitutia bacterium]